jgi:ABC-2 type transport system ATP-binding protein/lipopolysaccharide transport system ATP-binding protein
VLWLEGGRVRALGEPRRVIDAYREAVADGEEDRHRRSREATVEAAPDAEPERWGSGEAEISNARLLVGDQERYHLHSAEPATIELTVALENEVDDIVFGIAISTPRGVEVFGTNTDLAGLAPASLGAGRHRVALELPELCLAAGEYLVDVATHARDGKPYDYRRRALSFSVTSTERGVGVYLPRHQWSLPAGFDRRLARRGG